MELAQTTKKIELLFSTRFKELLKNRDRYLVLYGGRGSGKSEFAARKLFLRCMFEGNHRFLMMRKVRSRCRESVTRVMLTLLDEAGVRYNHNETKREISFRGMTGAMNVIVYDGLDDPDKIKSIKGITGVWLEEATEFTQNDFTIIDLCLREEADHYHQVMMTFNPDEARARWIKRRFFTGFPDAYTGSGNIESSFLHHSTIEDNPIDAVRNSYRKLLDQIDDPVYRKIFKLGVWSIARGIIYKHPRIIPLSEYPKEYDDEFYGLDFGFNNPSALIWHGIKDLIIYLRQIIYQTHLTTSDLIEKMKDENVKPKVPIYADPSAPGDIEEVLRAGFKCKAAISHKGSVYTGIMFVRSKELITCEENEQINDEFTTYKWKEDKAGEPLDEPVKLDDHGMDGVRYGIYSHLKKPEKATFLIGTADMY